LHTDILRIVGDLLRALADFCLNICALLLYICAAAIGAYAMIAGAIAALTIASYFGMACCCGYLIWHACSVIIYIIPIVLGIAEATIIYALAIIMCAAEFLFRGVIRILCGGIQTIVNVGEFLVHICWGTLCSFVSGLIYFPGVGEFLLRICWGAIRIVCGGIRTIVDVGELLWRIRWEIIPIIGHSLESLSLYLFLGLFLPIRHTNTTYVFASQYDVPVCILVCMLYRNYYRRRAA